MKNGKRNVRTLPRQKIKKETRPLMNNSRPLIRGNTLLNTHAFHLGMESPIWMGFNLSHPTCSHKFHVFIMLLLYILQASMVWEGLTLNRRSTENPISFLGNGLITCNKTLKHLQQISFFFPVSLLKSLKVKVLNMWVTLCKNRS